jgi:hypothetical protein
MCISCLVSKCLFSSSLLWSILPTLCRCSELLFYLTTLNSTYTRQDLSGWKIGPSKRPLPDNTQHSQETDLHALGGIRNHNPNHRAAANLRLRPRGHRDHQNAHSPTKAYITMICHFVRDKQSICCHSSQKTLIFCRSLLLSFSWRIISAKHFFLYTFFHRDLWFYELERLSQ